MFFKTFTIALLLFLSASSSVSNADESIFEETKYVGEAISILSGKYTNKFSVGEEVKDELLRELEKGMEQGLDNSSFPVLFLRYITGCTKHKENKRAVDFFLALAEGHKTSPDALAAKGIVTYGWSAEKILRDGLKKIDEAISLGQNAFFPRLCRAVYLSYLPGEFMTAVNEFDSLLETERHDYSNLYDVYSHLVRVYAEHGHDDMAALINEKLLKEPGQINKKINYPHTNEGSLHNGENYNEIIRLPYPIMNNTITKKANAVKDRQLNEHLAILERNMERKFDDTIFGDIYKRYVLLAWQYGETDRAISFFEGLAERHPQSPNVLAATGTIVYGWKGQMLQQEGLDCIEKAIEFNGGTFFSRMCYATLVACFPDGFMKSMHEFSILRQAEKALPQRLRLINKRINLICLQHGHDREPEEYVAPVIKRRL